MDDRPSIRTLDLFIWVGLIVCIAVYYVTAPR